MACRSADRASPAAPHRAADRASAGRSAPRPPASPPLLPATARPAHAARAIPQNASVVPLAALPPGPFPAPLSSGSKTGQITRYKNRTDHESATPSPGRVASVNRDPVYSAHVIAEGRIMKLVSFTASGHSSYGAVVGDSIVDLGRRLGDQY